MKTVEKKDEKRKAEKKAEKKKLLGWIVDLKEDLREVQENIEYWQERKDTLKVNLIDIKDQLKALEE